MTEQERIRLCKDFTLLTGGHWHDYKFGTKNGNSYLKCSCGHLAYLGQFTKLNPTYINPADVLRIIIELPMYPDFIGWAEGDIAYDGRCYMPIDYFLEKDKLLKTAIEYLKEKQRT